MSLLRTPIGLDGFDEYLTSVRNGDMSLVQALDHMCETVTNSDGFSQLVDEIGEGA